MRMHKIGSTGMKGHMNPEFSKKRKGELLENQRIPSYTQLIQQPNNMHGNKEIKVKKVLYLQCGQNYGGRHLGLYRTVHQVQLEAATHPQHTQNISGNCCKKEVQKVFLSSPGKGFFPFIFVCHLRNMLNYLGKNVADAEAVRMRTPTTTNAMLKAATFRLFSSLIASVNTKKNSHHYFLK
jgi:hypothetical protein